MIVQDDDNNDRVVKANPDAEYSRWLSRMVVQMLVFNSVLPKGYVPGSIPLLLIGIAKAQLDGNALSVSDILAQAKGLESTSLRYIDVVERKGWVCRDPADSERCCLTEAGDALVRKMWHRSRYLYD